MEDINKLNFKIKKYSNKKNKKKSINYHNFLKKYKKRNADTIIKDNIKKDNKEYVKNLKKSYSIKKKIKVNNDKLEPKPEINIKDDKDKNDTIKKVKIEENIIDPVFKINRTLKKNKSTKRKKRKSKKKSKSKKSKSKSKRKVSIDLSNTNKNQININNINNSDMLKELEKKGIILKNKSNKLIKDIYACIITDNLNIKNE